MIARSRKFLRFIQLILYILLLVFVLFFAIILFLIITLPIVFLTLIPTWIGSRFPLDEWMRYLMSFILNFDRMRSFRDEMLEVYRRQKTFPADYDHWWMLREMELAKQRADSKIQNGRLVLAITAGMLSILLATYANVGAASIVLTLFVIGISMATVGRVIIIDALAFDAQLYAESPYEEVVARMGWNRGPINGRGAVLTAIGTIVAGVDEWGYNIGLEVVELIVSLRYGEEDQKKWEAEASDAELPKLFEIFDR